MINNLEYQIEKIADSLHNLNLEFRADGDFNYVINGIKNELKASNEIQGEKIVPTLSKLEKSLKLLQENENTKLANDTIIKLMEIKRSFDKKEISKDELLICANAIIKNFSSVNTVRESGESVGEIAKLISKTIKSKEAKTESDVSSCD